MVRKKKVLISFLILIIGTIIFAVTYDGGFGYYTEYERAQLEYEFRGTINKTYPEFSEENKAPFIGIKTDVVQLLKFSTRDYPTVRATIFIYTNKNSVNAKIDDGVSYNPVIQIPDEEGGIDKNPSGVVTQTIATDRPPKTSGNDYYHYWIEVSYLTVGDVGRGRTSSLDIINDKGLATKIENYYVQDMQQEFIRPSKDDNPRNIYRMDNKIQLQAKVRSGKVLGTFERTTKGGGTTVVIKEGIDAYDTHFSPLPDTVEYVDILEGKFRITALVDGVQQEVIKSISSIVDSTNYLKEDSSGWYLASANLDYPATWKSASSVTSVRVYFNARDKYGWGEEISLSTGIVEKDKPKLLSLTMTNSTLNQFMGQLQKSNRTSTFDSTSIKNATVKTKSNSLGLTESDLSSTSTSTGMGLNVKDGDKIKLEFFIDDESINYLSKEIYLIYNGVTYSASFIRTIVDTSGRGTSVSEWKVDNVVYKNSINNAKFSIRDDSSSPNQTDINANIFIQPDMLDNGSLTASTNTKKFSDEYFDGNIISGTSITGALGYLIVFDYDSTKIDLGGITGVYPSYNNKEWASYATKDFSFYEGKHTYNGKVYAMNLAGAIKEVTNASNKDALINNENVNNVISAIDISGKTFYVDTVKPSISNFKFEKSQDISLSVYLNNNSLARDILLGDISSSRYYKENDTLFTSLDLTENNFYKSLFDTDILNVYSTKLGGTEVSVNPTSGLEGDGSMYLNTSYKKTGYAKDLTPLGNAESLKAVNLLLYDKSGNETKVAFTSYYDDTIPNDITVSDMVNGKGPDNEDFRYTSNRNLPLQSKNGTNYSVAKLTSGGLSYIGDLRSSGTINLTSFSSDSGSLYAPVENAHNLFNLMTFSKSGKTGIDKSDGIILDRTINDNRLAITDKAYSYSETNRNYTVDFTRVLSTINELVGLSKYRIMSSSNGVRLYDGVSDKTINSTGVEVLLSNSNYYNVPGSTTYSSINNILLSSSGKIKFKVLLTDRLGNTKIMDYTVEVPDNVQLIGRTLDSEKEVKTIIKSSTEGTKVQTRQE